MISKKRVLKLSNDSDTGNLFYFYPPKSNAYIEFLLDLTGACFDGGVVLGVATDG